mmetsp:Transcript_15657/g.39669  ORF Transcript_15657/g.39669 Transcript_15657/m.39669 type:complete len:202 (-) Transcript_15657:103-708(-)
MASISRVTTSIFSLSSTADSYRAISSSSTACMFDSLLSIAATSAACAFKNASRSFLEANCRAMLGSRCASVSQVVVTIHIFGDTVDCEVPDAVAALSAAALVDLTCGKTCMNMRSLSVSCWYLNVPADDGCSAAPRSSKKPREDSASTSARDSVGSYFCRVFFPPPTTKVRRRQSNDVSRGWESRSSTSSDRDPRETPAQS